MSIDLKNGRCVRIMDRTLPALFNSGSCPSKQAIECFLDKLLALGIDVFEINAFLVDALANSKYRSHLLMRVETPEELEIAIHQGIGACVIQADKEHAKAMIQKAVSKGVGVLLEIYMENMAALELFSLKEWVQRYRGFQSIRLLGLHGIVSEEWMLRVQEIGRQAGLVIDICPENRCFSATAAAVEAVLGKADSITVTFTGAGGEFGFAAMEEVLTSIKVFCGFTIGPDLQMLPAVTAAYKVLSGKDIPSSKAVLGKDIFTYESGIHADGIEKDPSTYEPFNPVMVGQERRLVIGKHSGGRAICKKLSEFGIHFPMECITLILEKVRQKSMELGRSLRDEELVELCGVIQCN